MHSLAVLLHIIALVIRSYVAIGFSYLLCDK